MFKSRRAWVIPNGFLTGARFDAVESMHGVITVGDLATIPIPTIYQEQTMPTVSRRTFTITMAIIATAIMIVAIGMAMIKGEFLEEGRMLLASAWGRLTLIDLYVGILFFSVYVLWRERSAGTAALWIASFLVLGNLATAAYLVKAAYGADSVDDLMKRRTS